MFRFNKKKKIVDSLDPFFKRLNILNLPAIYRGLLIFITCLIIAILISPRIPTVIPMYQAGEVSDQNIKAPQDFLFEDSASTNKSG